MAVYDENSADDEARIRAAADYYIYEYKQLLNGNPQLFKEK